MAAPVWEGVGTAAAGVGTNTPGRPASIGANDILIAFHESADAPPAAPSGGWAHFPDSPQAGSGGSLATQTRIGVYWVRGDPGADPVFADTGNHGHVIIARISGVVTTGNPWDVTAGDADTSGSTTVTIPGDTTTENDCLIIAAATTALDGTTGDFSSWANADLTSVTERININTDAGNGGGIGVVTGVKATAGTFGATTATLGTSSKQGRVMVALRPAGAAATTVTPAQVDIPITLPTPTISAGATKEPGAVDIPITLPTPTPSIAATVTPAQVDIPITFPTPTIVIETPDTTVTPAAVDIPITLPTPTLSAGALVTPAAVDIPITFPTPTPQGAALVTPAAVSIPITFPTPTLSAGALVTPAAIPIPITLPGATPSIAALVTPAAIAIPITFPTPLASVPTTVTPEAVVVLFTLPTPTLSAGSRVTPAVIEMAWTLPTPTTLGGAVLEILTRVRGQFQRLGTNRLHISRVAHSGRRGFRVVEESWERVSDVFIFDDDPLGDGDHQEAMAAVAAAWAAHAGSDQATITAAINAALDSYGFRRPDGTRLI